MASQTLAHRSQNQNLLIFFSPLVSFSLFLSLTLTHFLLFSPARDTMHRDATRPRQCSVRRARGCFELHPALRVRTCRHISRDISTAVVSGQMRKSELPSCLRRSDRVAHSALCHHLHTRNFYRFPTTNWFHIFFLSLFLQIFKILFHWY